MKTLSDSQKQKLYELLLEHSDVFATKDSDLGRTTRLTHSIHTGNEAPIPGEFHTIRDKKLKAAGGLHRSNGMILNSNVREVLAFGLHYQNVYYVEET